MTDYVRASQIMVTNSLVVVLRNVGLNMVSAPQKHFRCTANYFFAISTDTTDGQDKYYRHCGRGLDTGCFIQTAENEVIKCPI